MTVVSFLLLLFAVSEGSAATPLVESRSRGAPLAEQESQSRSFTPHNTLLARTGNPGSVSVQQSPGANVNTSVFLSSIAVTVGRVEAGTIPLYWLADGHRWNATAKVGAYRSETLDLAVGATASEVLAENELKSPLRLGMQSLQFGVNYRTARSDPWWGAMVALSRSAVHWRDLDYRSGEEIYRSTGYYIRVQPEFALDCSLPLGMTDLTLGVGRFREKGFTAFEKQRYSGGLTIAWYRPKAFLSKPAFGVNYTPGTGKVQLLFSTSFN